jgi:hypothetical protein
VAPVHAEPVREPQPVAAAPEAPRNAKPAAQPPPFADFVVPFSPEMVAPHWTNLPLLVAAEPANYESDLSDSLTKPGSESLSDANALPVSVEPVEIPVHAACLVWAAAAPSPLPTRSALQPVVASHLAPARSNWGLAEKDHTFPRKPSIAGQDIHLTKVAARAVPFGDPLRMEPIFPNRPTVYEGGLEPVSIAAKTAQPEQLPQPKPVAAPSEPASLIPPLAGWQHKTTSLASVSCAPVLGESRSPEPLALRPSPLVKPDLDGCAGLQFAPQLGSLRPLPLNVPTSEPEARPTNWTWFRLGAFNPPQFSASLLSVFEPRLRPARGCRYAMNSGYAMNQSRVPLHQAPVHVATATAVRFPALPPVEWQLHRDFVPGSAAMSDLTGWKSEIPPRNVEIVTAHAVGSPQAEVFPSVCWIVPLRLQPLKWVPPQPAAVEDSAVDEPAKNSPPADFQTEPHPQLGHLLLGFWKNAPRDLRLLMFAIPALLALAFHPALPKVHVSTVQATEPMQRNVGQAVNGSWTTFKQTVSERAAVALDEDFRSGLDDWSSPGGSATEWSFDANGFVRPGTLALYSPSMALTDYELQFLGVIDQKAMSWVVRAQDFANYYVVKIVVVKPGPLTTLGLTRYAVIDGKPQDRVDAVVPFTARPDMIYRVRMDVHDDSFVLAIQGQMVDAWSEPRLRKGGIGFFSARGEGSRVRWLQVTHQYDMLGRLCSYLAPYDLSSASVMPTETTTKSNSTNNNGSWQR